jgi:hypothetical protein
MTHEWLGIRVDLIDVAVFGIFIAALALRELTRIATSLRTLTDTAADRGV